MIKFIVLAEVSMDEEKYKEVESWEVEPVRYVDSVIADHARDRGLVLRLTVTETESSMYDTLNEVLIDASYRKAMEALEEEVLAGKACINGTCED